MNHPRYNDTMYFTFWQLVRQGDTYMAQPYLNIYKDMIEWKPRGKK